MLETASFFMVALSAVFVVVDPIATAPIFASLTSSLPRADVQSVARRGAIVGGGLLVFFTVFGGLLFRMLNVELGAFRVAGGILLLLTSLDMLRARIPEARCTRSEIDERSAERDDIAIVPVATPLLAGPGAMATVMMLTSERQGVASVVAVLAAVALTFAATYVVLVSARRVTAALGRSGAAILQRVMGLVLAAVAIQFVADGGKALLG